MVYHLLIALSGIVIMVLLWVGVQALVRRQAPEIAADEDVLRCGMCGVDGTCLCGLRQDVAPRDGKARHTDGG